MKTNKSIVKTQRKSLDEKLKPLQEFRTRLTPKSGWIRSIRQSLGMTTAQLADRLGIQQSGVVLLEQREVKKNITLETLEKAALALDCDFIYSFVPKTSLEKTVDDQAMRSAKSIMQKTLHSMALEKQVVTSPETESQLQVLKDEIKTKLDSRLWGKK